MYSRQWCSLLILPCLFLEDILSSGRILVTTNCHFPLCNSGVIFAISYSTSDFHYPGLTIVCSEGYCLRQRLFRMCYILVGLIRFVKQLSRIILSWVCFHKIGCDIREPIHTDIYIRKSISSVEKNFMLLTFPQNLPLPPIF